MTFAFGKPSCGCALHCVGAPNLRTCGRALRLHCGCAFWRPTCGCALHRVEAPNLRTCLALRWGAQLADVPFVAFGRPSCGRTLRCVGAPNLGEAVLKILPLSQVLPCVDIFHPPARLLAKCSLVWTFSLRIGFSFGRPSCRRVARCVWAPVLRTRLSLHCGAQPW
jgi:hypothetical protein